MRRSAAERVFRTDDVQAAGTETWCRARRDAAGMAAHENVHAVERVREVHLGFRVGRHHLLARRAEHGHTPGTPGAGQEFRNRDSSREADRALRAVLIAVKWPPGTAQRVIFDDDADVRSAVVLAVLRDECG